MAIIVEHMSKINLYVQVINIIIFIILSSLH